MNEVAAKDTPETPGSILKQARERRGIGVGDVATSLHLDESVVVAIEEGRNDELPAEPYVRGYVRGYARLVGVDAAPLTKRIKVVRRAPRGMLLPAALKPSFADRLQRHLGLLIGGIVVAVLIAAAAVLWLVGRSYEWSFGWPFVPTDESEPAVVRQTTESPPASTESPRVTAEPPISEASEAPRPTTDNSDSDAGGDSDDGDAPAPAGVSENALATSVAANIGTLTFRFNENSWLEVHDASGEMIHADLGLAGRTVVVTGEAPFRILIGHAAGVELDFNGDPVALRPHTRQNVARLVIGQ